MTGSFYEDVLEKPKEKEKLNFGNQLSVKNEAGIIRLHELIQGLNQNIPEHNSGMFVRWRGLEPPRLTTHAPQACLSANSSTSASRQYYNRVAFLVKHINIGELSWLE